MSVYDDLTTNRRQFSRAAGAAPLVGEHRAAPALTELARIFDPAPWQTDAACRGLPTEWWYPDKGEMDHRAKKICAECPVGDLCREYGADEQHGIWGGQALRTRRAERRNNGEPLTPGPRGRMVTRNATGPRPHTWAPIVHGDAIRGYKAEQRRGLDTCDACRNAWNAYKQDLKNRKTAA